MVARIGKDLINHSIFLGSSPHWTESCGSKRSHGWQAAQCHKSVAYDVMLATYWIDSCVRIGTNLLLTTLISSWDAGPAQTHNKIYPRQPSAGFGSETYITSHVYLKVNRKLPGSMIDRPDTLL